MSAVVLAFTNMLDGYGLASALIRQPEVGERDIRQLFGLLLNGGLAVVQVIAAPLLASYYRQPIIADTLRVQSLFYLTTPFIAPPRRCCAVSSISVDRPRSTWPPADVGLHRADRRVVGLGRLDSGCGSRSIVSDPRDRADLGSACSGTAAVPLLWRRAVDAIWRTDGDRQLFCLQSQSDVFIAGRTLSPHLLGIYTTSLFLVQIFVSKLVPPLNEVAFSAYARIQHDAHARRTAFLKAVQLVMLAALPFYGLGPPPSRWSTLCWVEVWTEVVPVVRLLAFAMPMMTLQVLYSPACDAIGRPGVGVANGAIGAWMLLTASFLIGVRYGVTGLATAWVAAYPLYLAISSRRVASDRRVVAQVHESRGARLAERGRDGDSRASARPPAAAAAAAPRLAVLVAAGAVCYAALLLTFARGTMREVVRLVRA